MQTHETFYRPAAIRREDRTLPAPLYNMTRILLRHSGSGAVFVPIRSMSFQSVIDHEEIIFMDALAARNTIVVAWQSLRIRNRPGLDAPVPYTLVYYTSEALGIMPRLQSEFFRSISLLQQKQALMTTTTGTVLDITRKPRTGTSE
ncbi:MAG: hypothetical protein ACR2HF_08320 [Methylococcaceae bacterium]